MDYLANLLPEERENLKKRWQAYKHDMEWTSCKEYMSWAAANGYKKGLHLKKLDESKKHGPNNSHYEDSKEKELMRAEKHKQFMETRSPYCNGCTHELCPGRGTGGCDGWRRYWVDNWNKNIHWPPLEHPPVDQKLRQCFRYEHPDLVREGIVFESSSSV